MTETAATPAGVPVITADPFSQENLTEPHALHEQVNAALKDWKSLRAAAGG